MLVISKFSLSLTRVFELGATFLISFNKDSSEGPFLHNTELSYAHTTPLLPHFVPVEGGAYINHRVWHH